MTDPREPHVDHARLLALLESGDTDGIARAYRQVFGSELGRAVLTHQLAEAGVGQWRDHRMSGLERAHLDGEARHALRLLEHAGFGSISAAHLIAANSLEGQDHDRHDDGRRPGGDYSGPDGEPYSGPG